MNFLFKKKESNNLKSIRNLKREFPFFIYDLRSDFCKSKFNLNSSKLHSKILHKVLYKLFIHNDDLSKNLANSYYNNKKLIFPLPRIWLNIIEKKKNKS